MPSLQNEEYGQVKAYQELKKLTQVFRATPQAYLGRQVTLSKVLYGYTNVSGMSEPKGEPINKLTSS